MRSTIRISLAALILSFLSAGVRAEDSLTGHWKAEFKKAEVTRDYFLVIVQEGTRLRGSLISTRTRAYPFTSASVEGNRIFIDIERRYKEEDVVFRIRGEIEDNGEIRGTLVIGGEQIATIRMWRAPDPVGTWKVKARSLDSDEIYDSLLEIQRTGDGYTAKFTYEGRVLEVRETGWRQGRMILALDFPTDEGEVPILMAAEFGDENTILGEWGVPETDRRSEWSAKRVKPVKKPAAKEITKPVPATEAEKPAAKKTKPRPVTFVGEWRSTATTGDGETVRFALKFSGTGSDLRGEIAGTLPSGVDFKSKLTSIKVEDRKVSFSWELDADGNTHNIGMVGEVAKDGTMKGVWETDEDDGRWEGLRVMRL